MSNISNQSFMGARSKEWAVACIVLGLALASYFGIREAYYRDLDPYPSATIGQGGRLMNDGVRIEAGQCVIEINGSRGAVYFGPSCQDVSVTGLDKPDARSASGEEGR